MCIYIYIYIYLDFAERRRCPCLSCPINNTSTFVWWRFTSYRVVTHGNYEYRAAILENRITITMLHFPTQSHYPDSEQPSECNYPSNTEHHTSIIGISHWFHLAGIRTQYLPALESSHHCCWFVRFVRFTLIHTQIYIYVYKVLYGWSMNHQNLFATSSDLITHLQL